MNVKLGKKALARQGLNLFAVLTHKQYPADLITALSSIHIEATEYPSLILIGHAGRDLWYKVSERVGLEAEPIDEFSKQHARGFVTEFLDGCPYQIVYPGNANIPLQQLGVVAGWHHPSPLGVGLNRVFGPWFGYRVAILVGKKLSAMVEPAGDSPCEQCLDKPCLEVCPASALSANLAPDVRACIDHRLQDGSSCQRTCLARVACPVGREYRYLPEQLSYFYQRSLDSIRAHVQGRSAGNSP